ncbi:MAG: hypothetical protein Q9M97_02660 [Candidatus Gracilibacteria bacterium]|nr:hypothetical protein [Candidatus Gracilibacteria bacterium]
MSFTYETQYATSFSEENIKQNLKDSTKNSSGTNVEFNNHNVTFFFPGYGKKQRILSDEIIGKIENGEITDIVDVGMGGALDPDLKMGDFVFGKGDITIENNEPISENIRPNAEEIFRKIAEENGRGFYNSKILTTEKIIGPKKDRIELFKKTGAKIVQMEHIWFIEQIKNKLSEDAFKKLYITHLEIVSDEVPEKENFFLSVWGIMKAVKYVIIDNQKNIGVFKTKFLKEFLK